MLVKTKNVEYGGCVGKGKLYANICIYAMTFTIKKILGSFQVPELRNNHVILIW